MKRVVVIADDSLADRLVTEGLDTSGDPRFSVQEAAKMFFAKPPHWLRMHERKGHLIFNGEPIVVSRRTLSSRDTTVATRLYTLGEIERIAHALAASDKAPTYGALDLQHTVALIRAEAYLWGYFSDDDPDGEAGGKRA